MLRESDTSELSKYRSTSQQANEIVEGLRSERNSLDQNFQQPDLMKPFLVRNSSAVSGQVGDDEKLNITESESPLEINPNVLLNSVQIEKTIEELLTERDIIPKSEKLEIAALSEQLVDEQDKIKEILSSPLFAYNEGLLLLLRNISTAANPKARGGMVANLDAAIRKLKEGSNFSFRVKKAAVRVEDIEPKISNPLYLKHGDSQVIAQTIWSSQDQVIRELLVNGWIEGGYKGTSNARKFTKADPAGQLEIIFNYGGGLHDSAGFAQQQVSDPLYIKVIRPPHNTIKVVDRNGYSDDDIRAQGGKILFYNKVDFSPINL